MNQTFQKIVGAGLALTAVFSLAACGKKTETNPNDNASGKTYKVGIVQFVDDASLNQIEENIEKELDAKAAELGVTFDYADYTYNGQADSTTLNQIGAELVSKDVDIIIPIATPAAQVMQSVTEDTDIPIVFSAVSDPVGAKLVASMDAPGGKITGTSDSLNTKAIIDLMLAANPDTQYVGLLYSKSEDSSKQPIADAIAYLESKGIRYIEKTGTNTDEISSAADALIAEKKAAGQMGVGSHPRTRPDFLEAEAVSRLLRIAQAVDIPVVIVHLTNEAALREVEAARKRGQRVYVETCPQYLVLEDSVYDAPEYSMAARYVCAPPIRKERDQQALWTALRKGEIQTVSTDHCSFTLEQKDAGRGDFTKIPGGLPGVENRGELLYTYGVTTRKISLATMCRVLSENPAKLYGMFPRKGVLQDGADADIVVYDPQADHVLRAEDMASLAGYSPYEGFAIRGGIHQVWLRGRLAVEDGFVLAGPDGKYIPRGKCSL